MPLHPELTPPNKVVNTPVPEASRALPLWVTRMEAYSGSCSKSRGPVDTGGGGKVSSQVGRGSGRGGLVWQERCEGCGPLVP